MKEFIKTVKEIQPLIIVILLVILLVQFCDRSHQEDRVESELYTLKDSLNIVNAKNQLLTQQSKERVQVLLDSNKSLNIRLLSVNSSLIELKKNHQTKLDRISRISTDSNIIVLKENLQGNKYPKKFTLESDTVVAITPNQTREINRTYISLQFYKSTTDTLEKKIEILNSKLENDSLQILELNQQITLCESTNKNKDILQQKTEQEYQKVQSDINKLRKSNKWLKNSLLGSLALNLVQALVLSIK